MSTRHATLDYWQVKAAFAAVLELDPAAQNIHLEALQEQQPALAQALRTRLLRLQDSPAASAAGRPDIAGYRILESLGSGGMGQVWRVQRATQPTQQLALKQLHADQHDPQLLRRFEQERRVLAQLNHPHIVALVDAGLDTDGRPYLVTPWVDGQRIDRWCDQQASSVAQRVRLITDIAGALAHAHGQLIVHCDLKPANVLVDRSGQVRLLDFGIARLLDGSNTSSTELSLMTLRYAAPEQVAATTIGPACDLYALGVLLYELLSGQSPYPDLSSPAALLQAIAQHEPRAPSQLGVTPRRVRLDADLDAIVLKLLRKRAQDRYGSALELVDDLRRWHDGAAVHARSDERGYLLRRWLRQYRWLMTAAGVLLLLLGGHVWQLDRALTATAEQRDRARVVADYFVQLFRNSTPGETQDGGVRALTLLDRSAARLADHTESPGLSPSTRALLQLVSGRVYADLGQVAQAEPLLAAALAQLQQEHPVPLDELVDGYKTHAAVLYQLDQVPQSLARSQSAIALLEAHGETRSERYAGMLQNAAIALHTLGRNDEGDAALRAALQVLDVNQARMRRAYILLLQNLADAALIEQHTQQALEYLQRAERALPDLRPADPDLQLSVQRALLTVQRDAGIDVRPGLHTWLPRARAHYGEAHLETALWLELAGIVALAIPDLGAARAAFEDASRIAVQLYAQPAHHYRLRFQRNLLLHRTALLHQSAVEEQRLVSEVQGLLKLRQGLGTPDSSELLLESALLAWLRCRQSAELAQRTHFHQTRTELLADPRQEIWHQQLARGWRCD